MSHEASVAAQWYAGLRGENVQYCLTCRHSEPAQGSFLIRHCWVDAGEEEDSVIVQVRHRCSRWEKSDA